MTPKELKLYVKCFAYLEMKEVEERKRLLEIAVEREKLLKGLIKRL